MNIELRYFTGTGNSLKITETCKKTFIQANHQVLVSEINFEEPHGAPSDLLGFCFPVYAFGLPRICRRYLKSLPLFGNKQRAFVIITAGDSDESGFAVKECEKILRKKNCDLIYSAVVQMPINWTTSPTPPFPPSKEMAAGIIEQGIAHARQIASEIVDGKNRYHEFNYPKRFTKLKFYSDYLLFKHVGLQNLWRTFMVYETCNGCSLCSTICPTKSITMVDRKPCWASSCEQCMRCVNFCPNEAIYQTMGGETKGKNKYYEPDFSIKARSVK